MKYSLKSYGLENIGKNISKILSGKYSQTLSDHAKQTAAGERETERDRDRDRETETETERCSLAFL